MDGINIRIFFNKCSDSHANDIPNSENIFATAEKSFFDNGNIIKFLISHGSIFAAKNTAKQFFFVVSALCQYHYNFIQKKMK